MKLADLGTGRTLVLGFGREGRALERVVLQRVSEARVEVLCDREPDVPPRSWPLTVGGLDGQARAPDRVLRSPGVPVDHPVLARWRAAGVAVTCISSLWFAERTGARVIAVTGSKGKSTTAALIAHLLAAAGQSVELGGNIGVPVLELIDATPDWFVVELSSYQLADLRGHATIGVITRLFPEHQDWHGDAERYYAAKLRLAVLLAGRPLWINAGDPFLARVVAGLPALHRVNGDSSSIRVCDDGIRRGPRQVLSSGHSPLVGRHNLDNIALALGVVESITGEFEDPGAPLASFRPLPHRLEPLAGPDGIRWINDSISTTPYATLAALQASAPDPVLIVGGMERGADWRMVAEYCRGRRLAGLVGLPDNGAAVCRLLTDAGAVEPERVVEADGMEAAVTAAWRLCRPGGCVVLSPGAPSFPRFRDFEQRGQAFVEAVKAVTERRGR